MNLKMKTMKNNWRLPRLWWELSLSNGVEIILFRSWKIFFLGVGGGEVRWGEELGNYIKLFMEGWILTNFHSKSFIRPITWNNYE